MADRQYRTPPPDHSTFNGGRGSELVVSPVGPNLMWHICVNSGPPFSKPVTAYPLLRVNYQTGFPYHFHSPKSLSTTAACKSCVITLPAYHPPVTHHMSNTIFLSPTHYHPHNPHTPNTHLLPSTSSPRYLLSNQYA
jgi:hypothetical protein